MVFRDYFLRTTYGIRPKSHKNKEQLLGIQFWHKNNFSKISVGTLEFFDFLRVFMNILEKNIFFIRTTEKKF